MKSLIEAGGGIPDLLSSIYEVEIRNEEKISEEDREFCQQQQEKLYAVLGQLDWWYNLYTANSKRYAESHHLKYAENGSVDSREPYRPHDTVEDYSAYEYKPFDGTNKVVQLYYKAVNRFSTDITQYFNCKYDVEVPLPDVNPDQIKILFRPTYQTHVDHVIAHLGGRSFRETAEEELIQRFLSVVRPWGWDTAKPEVKGKKIIFPRAVTYTDYSWDDQNKISWSNRENFERFCAGIYFTLFRSLNGHSGMIAGFDNENVDFSKQYFLTVNGKATLKLYKNGRADVTYSDNDKANTALRLLRLDTLKLPKERV